MSHFAIILTLLSIFLWSTCAYVGLQLAHMPAFLLLGVALCIGGMCGVPQMRQCHVSWRLLLLGVYGILGTNVFFILAFRYAPPVEASLIYYLWPLLVVLLSPVFLPGYTLLRRHWLSAIIGCTGMVLIVSNGHLALHAEYLRGYLYALIGAFVWASYSLMSKRLPALPTAAIGLFCMASGALSLMLHVLFEPHYVFQSRDMAYLIYLGLLPFGIVYFLWDRALKIGDPRVIGTLAYLSPMFSTLLLILAGKEKLSLPSGLAMLLIAGGALIGAVAPLRAAAKKSRAVL